jgi:hypothetical protein
MLSVPALLAAAAGALLMTVGSATADSTSISVDNLQRVGEVGAYMPATVIGRLGDTVDYQIIVTNNGSEAVTVNLGASGCSGVAPSGAQTVQPDGGYVAFTCTHALSPSDGGSWSNIATVSGTTASGAAFSLAPVSSVAVVAVIGNLAGAHKTIHHKRHRHHLKPKA